MFKGCKDGVHKFEPRYHHKFPDGLFSRVTSIEADGGAILQEKIYICDVCVRCGIRTNARVDNE